MDKSGQGFMKDFKHISLLFFSLLLLFSVLSGQSNFTVNVGEDFEIANVKPDNFIVEDDSIFYSLLPNKDGFVEFNCDRDAQILVFDRQLNPIKQITISNNSSEKIRKLKPLKFFKTDTGYMLLCWRFISSSKVISSFLIQIDDSGSVVSLKNPGVIEDQTNLEADFKYFDLNEMMVDSTCHYVFTFSTPASLNISERINFIIYDEDLEILDKRLLDYPDDYLDYNISEMIFSKWGIVYVRVEIFNPFEPEILIHQIIIYDILKDDFNTFELKFDEGVVEDSDLFILRENTIALSGYFIKEEFKESPQGVFCYLFDAQSGSALKRLIYHFSKAEKDMLISNMASSDSEIKNLKSAAVHLSQHNNILLLFEYNWNSIMLIRGKEGMLYDKPYFNANEIFIFQFDASDQLIHTSIVAKKQFLGFGNEILGFHSFLSGNELCLLYNDHPKNRDHFVQKELKTMKGNYEMMQGDFDLFSGEFSKQPFLVPNQSIKFDPGNVVSIKDNMLLFFDSSEKSRLIQIIKD